MLAVFIIDHRRMDGMLEHARQTGASVAGSATDAAADRGDYDNGSATC
jgi:hypothetical protein